MTSLRQGACPTLRDWAATRQRVHIDIGTGDGVLALHLARMHPDTAVIGLDINLDRLRGAPKRNPANLRFFAADALDWPQDWLPAADAVTIAFPYGSLLRGLVEGDDRLVERLDALLRPGSQIDVRVNASALVAGGIDPAGAATDIVTALRRVDGLACRIAPLDRAGLRAFPSRWSKRLGYGRPADAWLFAGTRRRIAARQTRLDDAGRTERDAA